MWSRLSVNDDSWKRCAKLFRCQKRRFKFDVNDSNQISINSEVIVEVDDNKHCMSDDAVHIKDEYKYTYDENKLQHTRTSYRPCALFMPQAFLRDGTYTYELTWAGSFGSKKFGYVFKTTGAEDKSVIVFTWKKKRRRVYKKKVIYGAMSLCTN